MGSTIGFAEVAGAIIGAIGLALGLEWLTLSTLMRLMPRHGEHTHNGKLPRHP